jgi:hypothetical protein
MSRYPQVVNRNFRDDSTTWPHHEMWKEWLATVETERLSQRKEKHGTQKRSVD